jgi:hypothetical protein
VAVEVRSAPSDEQEVKFNIRLHQDVSNYIELWHNVANWQLYTEDGGVSSQEDLGITPVNDTFDIARFQCMVHGSSHVHAYIDGVEGAGSPKSDNIPDDDYFYLIFRAENDNAGVAEYIDVDYIAVRQDR